MSTTEQKGTVNSGQVVPEEGATEALSAATLQSTSPEDAAVVTAEKTAFHARLEAFLQGEGSGLQKLLVEAGVKKPGKTMEILSGIRALLEANAIEDEADRKMVSEAATFIEAPSEDLNDLMTHTTYIGMVVGGYDMMGMDVPPAIDAMHGYLLGLQCIHQMNYIWNELRSGAPNFDQIRKAMDLTLSWAGILAQGYKDNSFLDAANELFALLSEPKN